MPSRANAFGHALERHVRLGQHPARLPCRRPWDSRTDVDAGSGCGSGSDLGWEQAPETTQVHPGVDLLLTADWAKLVKAQLAADQGLPILPPLAEAAPETVTISGTPDKTPAGPDGARSPADSFQHAGVFALATLLVAGFFWWRRN